MGDGGVILGMLTDSMPVNVHVKLVLCFIVVCVHQNNNIKLVCHYIPWPTVQDGHQVLGHDDDCECDQYNQPLMVRGRDIIMMHSVHRLGGECCVEK